MYDRDSLAEFLSLEDDGLEETGLESSVSGDIVAEPTTDEYLDMEEADEELESEVEEAEKVEEQLEKLQEVRSELEEQASVIESLLEDQAASAAESEEEDEEEEEDSDSDDNDDDDDEEDSNEGDVESAAESVTPEAASVAQECFLNTIRGMGYTEPYKVIGNYYVSHESISMDPYSSLMVTHEGIMDIINKVGAKIDKMTEAVRFTISRIGTKAKARVGRRVARARAMIARINPEIFKGDIKVGHNELTRVYSRLPLLALGMQGDLNKMLTFNNGIAAKVANDGKVIQQILNTIKVGVMQKGITAAQVIDEVSKLAPSTYAGLKLDSVINNKIKDGGNWFTGKYIASAPFLLGGLGGGTITIGALCLTGKDEELYAKSNNKLLKLLSVAVPGAGVALAAGALQAAGNAKTMKNVNGIIAARSAKTTRTGKMTKKAAGLLASSQRWANRWEKFAIRSRQLKIAAGTAAAIFIFWELMRNSNFVFKTKTISFTTKDVDKISGSLGQIKGSVARQFADNIMTGANTLNQGIQAAMKEAPAIKKQISEIVKSTSEFMTGAEDEGAAPIPTGALHKLAAFGETIYNKFLVNSIYDCAHYVENSAALLGVVTSQNVQFNDREMSRTARGYHTDSEAERLDRGYARANMTGGQRVVDTVQHELKERTKSY